MKGPALLWLTVACIASAAGTTVWLLARRWRGGVSGGRDARSSLPMWMQLATPVALLIEPLVEPLLSGNRRQFVARELEAMGLSHLLTPARHDALVGGLAFCAGIPLALVIPGSSWPALLGGAMALLAGARWLPRQREIRQQAIARELPSWLDLMTVSVEAGSTLTAGLRLATERAPQTPLREYFERVLREIRGGRPRAQSFSHVAGIYANESLAAVASALEHAESSGMSLGQVLRAQARQRTAERFARAEKLAMQAPVKMLGPLILCIFPCTFIVIGVPIAVRLKEALGA